MKNLLLLAMIALFSVSVSASDAAECPDADGDGTPDECCTENCSEE